MNHLAADSTLSPLLPRHPNTIGTLVVEMVDYVMSLIWKDHIASTKKAELCKIKLKASPDMVVWLLKKFGPLLTIEVDDAPSRFNRINGLWSESPIGNYEDIFISSIPTALDQQPVEYAIRFRREGI
jgi:hypothetical protein